MKKLSFLFLMVTLVLTVSALRVSNSEAYVLIPSGSGNQVRWNLAANGGVVQNGRVVYNLNPAGSDNVPFNQVESSITSAFQSWEDLPDSALAFTRGPNSTAKGTAADATFQVYWAESTTEVGYADLSGALGVTFVAFRSTGELVDASMILNGVDYTWAADGRSDALDIAEVVTHEIGHSFGLTHSGVANATMFPRTGLGITRARTLASDDALAVAAIYPVSDLAGRTGVLRGTVRDNNGATIFGAHVVASDSNGNVAASALSQPDGSYRIGGLPPGGYTVFAEPIDEEIGTAFYGKADLSSFYDPAVTNFLTTNDQTVSVRGGGETALDFTVTRGTPAFNPFLVYQANGSGQIVNTGTALNAGTTTTVGLAGPGLPTTGTPLSISGSGITVTRTRSGSYSGLGGGQAVIIDINVAADAPAGLRTLFISDGSQRAAIAGAVEIIGTSAPPPPLLTTVSAANYTTTVARESVASVFGTRLANSEAKGRTNPLPTELNGVRVAVRDANGKERNAPLFYVSPAQINYQIPPDSALGSATINFFNNGALTGRSTLNLENIAPGLFTLNANGRGPVAGLFLRVRANGQQIYENVATLTNSQWQTLPVDWSNATDQLFLVLFGTGLRFRSGLNAVTSNVGGAGQAVVYAGAQGSLVGLDQINLQLNRANLIGRSEVDVSLTVDGKPSNTVKVNFK